MIASLDNPLVKHLVKIRENRNYREEKGTILVSGYKVIKELATFFTPLKLFLENPADASIAPKRLEIFHVNHTVLKKITGLPSPEPIAAEFSLPKPQTLIDKSFVLVLDAIQDPGNLGTLLRTALAFGWGGVFFMPNCVDPFNEKVVRSSRAALFYLPWCTASWEEVAQIKSRGQFKLYVGDIEGKPLNTITPEKKIMLCLSNEARGADQLADRLGEKITVPMMGRMESLNVAIAGAIMMYHMSVENEK